MYALCFGLMLFSLATSMFFTPLPIFFSESLAFPTVQFLVCFSLNSLGCLIGYILTHRNHRDIKETSIITRISLLRGLLVFLFLFVVVLSLMGAMVLSVMVLILSGFFYAFYSVSVLSLSMEVIPRGKTGIFTALLGAGSGIGCLTGPILAENFGFSSHIYCVPQPFSSLAFCNIQNFHKKPIYPIDLKQILSLHINSRVLFLVFY